MAEQNIDYAAIRRKVENGVQFRRRLNRWIFFTVHLVFFVVAMLFTWGTVLNDSQIRAVLFGGNQSAAAGIVIVPSILWALLLLSHTAALYNESRSAEKALREKLLRAEIGQEILRKGLIDEAIPEKPKREAAALEAQRVLLSDDGELVPFDEDEQVAQSSNNARTNRASKS